MNRCGKLSSSCRLANTLLSMLGRPAGPPSFHFFLIRWRFDLPAKPHAELHRAASAIGRIMEKGALRRPLARTLANGSPFLAAQERLPPQEAL